MIQALFAGQVLVHLRAVQAILRLEKSYGRQRLKAACDRAMHFDTLRYRSVKAILAKGLDLDVTPSSADTELPNTCTHGGRFCRDTPTLLH